jgi:hypothetical protein
MANDFDAELDSIFSEREASNAKARREVAQQTAATAAFAKAWDQFCTNVVMPVFNQAAAALGRRGVTADIGRSPRIAAELTAQCLDCRSFAD